MKIQQLYYTSCRNGMSLSSGFQTYSMSEGISEQERKEIESYCVYIPPVNLPTKPTKEEIDRLFPIAFSSFKLSNGKNVICRAKYIGKDYTGRYGNYFCHVLLLEEGDWPFYPIQLFGSSIFKDSLNEEEEIAEEISLLPVLEEVPLGNIITLDSVGEFLKGTGVTRRSKIFKSMMDGVISYENHNKAIVFCDENNNFHYWIGAIQLSLPLKMVKDMSFTTYRYSLENIDFIITGTSNEGTKFNFNELDKLDKYNIFDIPKGINSEIKEEYKFSKLAQVGLTISNESLQSFIKFIEEYKYYKLDEKIDSAMCLFNIVKKGIYNIDVTSVKKAIDFINNYGDEYVFEEFLIQIEPMLKVISGDVDLELSEIISIFLFKIAMQTGKENYIKRAYEFFFDSLYYMVADAEEIEISDIIKLHDKIRSLNETRISEFVKHSFDISRMEDLYIYMEGAKSRQAHFYVYIFMSNMIYYYSKTSIKLEWRAIENISKLKEFIERCLAILIFHEKELESILELLYLNIDCYANVIVMSYRLAASNKNQDYAWNIVKLHSEAEKENSSMWVSETRNKIHSLKGGDHLLLKTYVLGLENAEDKEVYFWKYCKNTIECIPQFGSKYYGIVLQKYLYSFKSKRINKGEFGKILYFTETQGLQYCVDKKLLIALIENFEDNLSIENKENIPSETVIKVFNMKKSVNIRTTPDVTSLITFGLSLKSGNSISKVKEEEIIDIFNGIDSYTYRKYLRWYLFNIYMSSCGAIKYEQIEKLCIKEYEELFIQVNLKLLEDILNKEKDFKGLIDIFEELEMQYFELFIEFFAYVFNRSYEENIKQFVIKQSINMLKDKPNREIKRYKDYMEEILSGYKKRRIIRTAWEVVCTELDKTKGGFMNFIKS